MNRRDFLLAIPFIAVASKIVEAKPIGMPGLTGPTGPVGITGAPSIASSDGSIQFINGVLTIDIEKNYELYRALELHPMNDSNRRNPLFTRVS